MKQTQYAPVALFVYNRLKNTQKTIEYLKKNILSAETILYIFSDGGKDEHSWKEVNKVRAFLHTITGFKEIHIIERPENYYLERNVLEGINFVFTKWDKIIVLEDDICTSPYFLKYMNDAFVIYKNEKRVMHIAGFTFLDVEEKGDTYFTPYMAGSGAWGTWKDRWVHFKYYQNREEALNGFSEVDLKRLQYNGTFQGLKLLDRHPIPWDICWLLAIRKRNGLCLSPTHTLIRNIGLYSGTHFNNYRILGTYEYDRPFWDKEIRLKSQNIEPDEDIEAMYPAAFKDHGMRYTLLGKIIRYFYLKYIK